MNGPNGEPWHTIILMDEEGNIYRTIDGDPYGGEIQYHNNGHYWDPTFDPTVSNPRVDPPHFHGPEGEHIFHRDPPSPWLSD